MEEIKYLGSNIQINGQCTEEVEARECKTMTIKGDLQERDILEERVMGDLNEVFYWEQQGWTGLKMSR